MARKPTVPQHICEVLKEHHLLTAPAILEVLTAKYQQYNKTSVYRALEKLLDEGKICRHLLAGAEVQYELRSHHHDHSVCTSCHNVTAIDCVEQPAPKLPGFTAQHHHTTMYGICDACKTYVSKNG